MADDTFPFRISPSTPFLEVHHAEHGASWVEFDCWHASLEDVPRVRVTFGRCVAVRSDRMNFEGGHSDAGILKESRWLRSLNEWQRRHYPAHADNFLDMRHYFFRGHDEVVEVLAERHEWSYIRRPR